MYAGVRVRHSRTHDFGRGSRGSGLEVFFEPAATGDSAYVPGLPGCVAAGSILKETRQLIREAIEFHIEGMRLDGETVPEPTSPIGQIEVSA